MLDADGKKEESSCFPFVAQSGYARCVLRLFRPVVSDPIGEWAKLAKLNKMAEGKEHKCRNF